MNEDPYFGREETYADIESPFPISRRKVIGAPCSVTYKERGVLLYRDILSSKQSLQFIPHAGHGFAVPIFRCSCEDTEWNVG